MLDLWFIGIVEPIRAKSRDAKLGLGKQEQDDYYTAEENVHRRKLEVEIEETEELARRREVIFLFLEETVWGACRGTRMAFILSDVSSIILKKGRQP